MDRAKEFDSVRIWSRQRLKLRNFANQLKELENAQPILICKGKYGNYGHPTLTEPNLKAEVFALCKRVRFKIRAQCVGFLSRWKWGIGPVFEMDDDFEGWFEYLSEEGNAMNHVRSVAELAPCTNRKCYFVVMESVHAHQRSSEGVWESCTLHVGYQFTVDGEILTAGLPACGCGRLLRCESALPDVVPSETIYLPVEGSGKFIERNSPVTVSHLPGTRFPVNVKLVEGSPRPIDFERFTPYIRLLSIACEEVLTVWSSMGTVDSLVHIPIECEMELQVLHKRKRKDGPKFPLTPFLRRYVEENILPKHKLKETHRPSHHQPSTSGPSSEYKNCIYFRYWVKKEYFEGSKAEFEASMFPNQRTSELVAAPKVNVPSVETGSMEPFVEQYSSGIATDHMENIIPLNINSEKAEDDQKTPNRDADKIKRPHSEPVKKDKQTTCLAATKTARRIKRIKTLHQSDGQDTENINLLNIKSENAEDVQKTLNLQAFKIKKRRLGTHEQLSTDNTSSQSSV